MKKSIIIPTVSLFVICLIATVLLALANNVTAPIIKQNAEQTEIASRKTVLSSAYEFKDEKSDNINYAVGYDKDGNVVGLVFTTTSKSYGGDLELMTGVDMNGKVTGVEILTINDTAGLGMNAQKETFREQFIGLVKGIKVQKNSSEHDKNEVTALTGATITSTAVATAVNDALSSFNSVASQYKQNGGAN